MKILIVFDSLIRMGGLKKVEHGGCGSAVDIFSLTSELAAAQRLKHELRDRKFDTVTDLNSAKSIDDQVSRLRQDLCRWTAKVGAMYIQGKTVKEWFQLPGENVSTWWFGLISEKNNSKTGAFLKIAQIQALHEILSRGAYDLCLVGILDRDLRRAIRSLCAEPKVQMKLIPVRPPQNVKLKVKYALKSFGLLGDLLLGMIHWLRFLRRSSMARRTLGLRTHRMPDSQHLLFISYFPLVERNALERGVFKNQYALALQEKLKELDLSMVWLFRCLELPGYDFDRAITLAAQLVRRGEKLFVLEEFLNFKDAVKSLALWFRQAFLSARLYGHMDERSLHSQPVGLLAQPVIKSLWNESFCGYAALEAILNYFIFRQALREIPYVSDCLYYAEMHGWEKAFNAAKKTEKPHVRAIGFQHSSVSRNFFPYFYDPSETRVRGDVQDMPLPDVLACNGELMHDHLSESGYPRLTQVEAARHLYLSKPLSNSFPIRRSAPALLVAGSIERLETRALAALVYAAFPSSERFKIWFKGHPWMPFELIFEESGIDLHKSRYVIRKDNLEECLEQAWAVLVPSSSVAIEALAFGCEVVVPIFSDFVNMSPLVGYEEYCHQVTSAQELKETMEKIVSGHVANDAAEKRQFVKKYWALDRTMPKWEQLLTRNRMAEIEDAESKRCYSHI